MLGELVTVEIISKNNREYICQVPEERSEVVLDKSEGDYEVGDKIEVFIHEYVNAKYNATIKTPKILLEELRLLEVVSVAKPGIFLDWGLDKDLFLPYPNTNFDLIEGNFYLVALIIDKNRKLCATTNIKDLLTDDSEYDTNDWVKGIVYNLNPAYGAFVAVDSKYDALINIEDLSEKLNIGDEIEARVISKNKDGKLNLSLRDKAYINIDGDAKLIYDKLVSNNGFLPYGDKSDSEAIRKEFLMSKSAFKKAIGRLYREKLINIENKSISKI